MCYECNNKSVALWKKKSHDIKYMVSSTCCHAEWPHRSFNYVSKYMSATEGIRIASIQTCAHCTCANLHIT